MMTNLVINASQHKNGNTTRLAKNYFARDYEQIDLVDYRIYQLGQNMADDEFDQVASKLVAADWIGLATPVYWHSMSGYLKTFLERLGNSQYAEQLSGKTLQLFVQGMEPSDTIAPTNAIFARFAHLNHMKFIPMK